MVLGSTKDGSDARRSRNWPHEVRLTKIKLTGLRQQTGFSISRLSLAQQTLYNALSRLILS